MTSFIDTHCHLEMLKLGTEDALEKAMAADVQQVITIATDEKSIRFVLKATEMYPQVFGCLGVHPHEAFTFSAEIAEQIRNGAILSERIVAVGETGLDYHYMHSEKEVQQEVFHQQLMLAEELALPVVLHSRDAQDDTLRILRQNPVTRKGVAHSFTSGLEMARSLLEMDWYIGINGIATFRNAEDVREVACYVPMDRLLLETDSPFLAPIPFRGKPNDPSNIPVIAEFLANERRVSLDDFVAQTTENAYRLFAIKSPS
ncbi:MAG: TatD family hydrolase [SAR324 cluster bacterium]|nr:TatD family hydrolase [SAR324 cluster bacterium]